MKPLLAVAVVVLAALAAAPIAGATNECRGLNPCVPIAGPWVAVPGSPAPVQYQLTCPQGFVVAGLDAELTDPAIEISFIGASGAPVGPGITTSRTVVFVGSYVGLSPKAPTFRPHAGCVPAAGGGPRTPTGVNAVSPPGKPTERRVKTARITADARITVSCKASERLVTWNFARAFGTKEPPAPALVSSLTATGRASGRQVVVTAKGGRGKGIVQVSAICAVGKQ